MGKDTAPMFMEGWIFPQGSGGSSECCVFGGTNLGSDFPVRRGTPARVIQTPSSVLELFFLGFRVPSVSLEIHTWSLKDHKR